MTQINRPIPIPRQGIVTRPNAPGVTPQIPSVKGVRIAREFQQMLGGVANLAQGIGQVAKEHRQEVEVLEFGHGTKEGIAFVPGISGKLEDGSIAIGPDEDTQGFVQRIMDAETQKMSPAFRRGFEGRVFGKFMGLIERKQATAKDQQDKNQFEHTQNAAVGTRDLDDLQSLIDSSRKLFPDWTENQHYSTLLRAGQDAAKAGDIEKLATLQEVLGDRFLAQQKDWERAATQANRIRKNARISDKNRIISNMIHGGSEDDLVKEKIEEFKSDVPDDVPGVWNAMLSKRQQERLQNQQEANFKNLQLEIDNRNSGYDEQPRPLTSIQMQIAESRNLPESDPRHLTHEQAKKTQRDLGVKVEKSISNEKLQRRKAGDPTVRSMTQADAPAILADMAKPFAYNIQTGQDGNPVATPLYDPKTGRFANKKFAAAYFEKIGIIPNKSIDQIATDATSNNRDDVLDAALTYREFKFRADTALAKSKNLSGLALTRMEFVISKINQSGVSPEFKNGEANPLYLEVTNKAVDEAMKITGDPMEGVVVTDVLMRMTGATNYSDATTVFSELIKKVVPVYLRERPRSFWFGADIEVQYPFKYRQKIEKLAAKYYTILTNQSGGQGNPIEESFKMAIGELDSDYTNFVMNGIRYVLEWGGASRDNPANKETAANLKEWFRFDVNLESRDGHSSFNKFVNTLVDPEIEDLPDTSRGLYIEDYEPFTSPDSQLYQFRHKETGILLTFKDGTPATYLPPSKQEDSLYAQKQRLKENQDINDGFLRQNKADLMEQMQWAMDQKRRRDSGLRYDMSFKMIEDQLTPANYAWYRKELLNKYVDEKRPDLVQVMLRQFHDIEIPKGTKPEIPNVNKDKWVRAMEFVEFIDPRSPRR